MTSAPKLHEYSFIGKDSSFAMKIPAGINFGKSNMNNTAKQRQVGLDKFWFLQKATTQIPSSLMVSVSDSSGKLTITGSSTNVLSIITPKPVPASPTEIFWLYCVDLGNDSSLIDPNSQEITITITDSDSQPIIPNPLTDSKFVLELSILDVDDE